MQITDFPILNPLGMGNQKAMLLSESWDLAFQLP